jgi:hypothetical protein
LICWPFVLNTMNLVLKGPLFIYTLVGLVFRKVLTGILF